MSTEVSLAGFARGFSCPQVDLDEPAFELLGIARARELTSLFVDRHGSALDPGLADVLLGWTTADTSLHVAWDPAFGPIEEAVLHEDAAQARAAAVRLALHLQASGHPGEWSAQLGAPMRLRWAQWLLPAAGGLSVSSDGQRATIQLSGPSEAQAVELAWQDGDWVTGGLDECPSIETGSGPLAILTRSAAAVPELEFLADQVAEDSEGDESRSVVAASLGLLGDHAPQYLTWVGRVLRDVVPIRATAGAINSGSSKALPGSCHVSIDVLPATLAEMLVHESTHGYFYMAAALGPVEDGSDTTLYYSPVKRRGRPIQFILLAYHAFANVLLLTRELREAGCPDPEGYLERNEEELVPQLDQLLEGLTATQGLTPLGEALWRPLAEQLA